MNVNVASPNADAAAARKTRNTKNVAVTTNSAADGLRVCSLSLQNQAQVAPADAFTQTCAFYNVHQLGEMIFGAGIVQYPETRQPIPVHELQAIARRTGVQEDSERYINALIRLRNAYDAYMDQHFLRLPGAMPRTTDVLELRRTAPEFLHDWLQQWTNGLIYETDYRRLAFRIVFRYDNGNDDDIEYGAVLVADRGLDGRDCDLVYVIGDDRILIEGEHEHLSAGRAFALPLPPGARVQTRTVYLYAATPTWLHDEWDWLSGSGLPSQSQSAGRRRRRRAQCPRRCT